jgi:hypothetical protein
LRSQAQNRIPGRGSAIFAPNPERIAMLQARTGRPVFFMGRGIDTTLFHPQAGQPYFFRQNRTCFCMQKGRYLALQYCLRAEKIGSINPRAEKLHAYRHTK